MWLNSSLRNPHLLACITDGTARASTHVASHWAHGAALTEVLAGLPRWGAEWLEQGPGCVSER